MQQRERDWSDLMRAAMAGDTVAYDRLLRALAVALRPQVRRALARAGQVALDPEDVVQEVLLAVHLKRHTWDATQPLAPWVRAVAHHKTVDAMRHHGWRVQIPIEDFVDVLPAEDVGPDVSDREVARHLERLPTGQREVLRAIAIAGSSIAETAGRLQMTQGAVRVALHRGLAALARIHDR